MTFTEPMTSQPSSFEWDKLREECGVAGVFGLSDASRLVYLSLFALQHRGQEACGLVTFHDHATVPAPLATEVNVHKAFGLVGDHMSEEILARHKGQISVGHVRYSTHGGAIVENIQPFQFKTILGPVAIAHNGNLTNADKIRQDLESSGSVFQSTSDSEVFVHLIARSDKKTIRDRILDAAKKVEGAYSLVIATKDTLFALRDPFGFRPLSIAKLGQGWVVASETCAFDLTRASHLRDVAPGELIQIDEAGLTSVIFDASKETKLCSFEHIYFSRPDSVLAGENVYVSRVRIGKKLAKECPAEGDLVMAIPDSGVAMAEGFSLQSGIPYKTGLVRNHYIGRTFIQPTQSERDFGVRLKLNPLRSVLDGKKVIVVDDSLVRGTTSARIFKMLRAAGVAEIHFRIGAPMIKYSCYYGVDTPSRKDLLASQLSLEEMRVYLGADSIGFISESGLTEALQGDHSSCGFCTACFNGNYPTPVS